LHKKYQWCFERVLRTDQKLGETK